MVMDAVMLLRILLLVMKSALMVALFDLISPVTDAIGFQLTFIATASRALSQATAMSYKEAQTLFLFLLATTILEIGRFVWELTSRYRRLG
jgi:hypothetical protein